MDHVGRIFRPPSEARSLLLQVTVGCSHNLCTYCDMYREKTFRPKPWNTILADIQEAARIGPRFKRVFLVDGDALILSQKKLLPILEAIETHLPWVERVGVYGDTRSVTRKSVGELRQLKAHGLGIVYHGMETGSQKVMDRIEKGATRAECIETAKRLRDAGILHSVMVLLGIGGQSYSEEHAACTASALTEMDPPFVGALTTTIVQGTPLSHAEASGDFVLPEVFTLLAELQTIVAQSTLSDCRFSANHASNYLPVTAHLPEQKNELLDLLSTVIKQRDPSLLKPEGLRGL